MILKGPMTSHAKAVVNLVFKTQGVLRKAPPRGPTPYPFLYHSIFDRKIALSYTIY